MSYETSSTNYDNLIAGPFPVVTEGGTVAQSQTITRGTVLGKVTAGGQLVVCDTANSDGSENIYGIALDAATTGVGETAAITVGLSGEYNSDSITLGGSTVVADVKAAARALGIYFKDGQY